MENGVCEHTNGAGKGGSDRMEMLWKSLSEWEGTLLEWAHRTGRKGDVLTLDELCRSSDVSGEDFCGMTLGLMEKILKRLEKQKKVMLFQGTDQDDLGVKFL